MLPSTSLFIQRLQGIRICVPSCTTIKRFEEVFLSSSVEQSAPCSSYCLFPLCVQPLYGAALCRLDQAALYRAMKA